ncbi:MAG: bi-domain-containing oxidoreductase [Opitutales bacterium]|nr:bi-domain-containing oxidoreductase [Opitutales bacterium]
MRQIVQHLGSGRTELLDVPAPGPRRGRLLIRATRSLVSLGTERMLVEFGRGGWFSKARQQPEKFRAVLAKIRSEGFFATLSAVRSKLAQPIPLGYCHVGQVLDAGEVHGFAAGDRVVSNSPHAEVVSADPAFAARIPEAVSDDHAAFTPLAAVALQGLRHIDARPGDTVVVMGLGLIGQLAVRLLRARGVTVVGVDPDEAKLADAKQAGAIVPPPGGSLASLVPGGVAGVLITASTASDEPVNQAARLCRRRGRVVLVGVTGLALNRADFYENEVTFQVSRSYGSADPADPSSARANFEEVLSLMASGALDVSPLLTSRHPFSAAPQIYDDLRRPGAYGLLIEYSVPNESLVRTLPGGDGDSRTAGGIGIIGCGNFASRVLVPELRRQGASPSVFASANGLTAKLLAGSAATATTDMTALLDDPKVSTVFIATRHAEHGELVRAALRAGKHVWVEKPLALTEADLDATMAVARSSSGLLAVGFNRRFAPLAVHLRAVLAKSKDSYSASILINAGRLPADHWTLDPRQGGGRIVGEASHSVDLLRYVMGCPIAEVRPLSRDTDGQDGGLFSLTFVNGRQVFLNYCTDLPAEHPKEKVMASGNGGWSVELDNWRSLRSPGSLYPDLHKSLPGAFAWPAWLGGPARGKGHAEALAAFLSAIRTGGPAPVSLDEIEEVSRWSIRMQGMKAA